MQQFKHWPTNVSGVVYLQCAAGRRTLVGGGVGNDVNVLIGLSLNAHCPALVLVRMDRAHTQENPAK